MSEFTVPYNFDPLHQMTEVLNDPHRFQVINWHRKARKTTLAVNQLIRWANLVKAPFWYVGPSYNLAKKTVWDDPRMFPQYIPDWKNPKSTFIKKKETELKVDFLHSGGQIYVFGADRPELMRGPNPFGVVLDEYAVMKEEVWNEVIQPIMRSNPDAWCWFLFTPRGKNHAFKAFQFGKRGDDEWKSWELTAKDSGIFTLEQLQNARRDMPEQIFNQELMCQFLETDGSVFRGVREIATAEPQKPISDHIYVMGVDLAKVTDWTVITVYDRTDNKQVYQDRFQKLEWPYQKAKIKSICYHYNQALTVLDATGLGDPIADDLARDGVPIEPYKLTSQSKKDIIEKLAIWIDQKKLRILPIQETLFEFDNFSYEISKTGRISYQALDGLHDDIVISHALAVYSLQPIYEEKPIILGTGEPPNRIKARFSRLKQEANEEDDGTQEWNSWNQDI